MCLALPMRITAVDGARVATGKDFNDLGVLTRADAAHLTEESATSLAAALDARIATIQEEKLDDDAAALTTWQRAMLADPSDTKPRAAAERLWLRLGAVPEHDLEPEGARE